MDKKPKCELTGTDGNIFVLTGKVSRALKKAGLREQAAEMSDKIKGSSSYYEALSIIQEYVNVS